MHEFDRHCRRPDGRLEAAAAMSSALASGAKSLQQALACLVLTA